MEAKTNYTFVGIVILLLTAGLIISIIWLSVGFSKNKTLNYLVYMKEAVSGLTEDAPVKYNGVKVGMVSNISLDPHNPQQVKLLLSIEEGTPITVSTVATLISQGITGTTYIGLSADSPSLEPLKKLPHEPYPIIPSKRSLLAQIDKMVKEISEDVSSVSSALKRVFNEKNTHNLEYTLSNLHRLTGNALKISQQMPTVIKEFKDGINKFNIMSEAVAKAGNRAALTMDTGKNAIDKIAQQTLPPITTLLQHLNQIAVNLENISSQIRQNPAIVIRGAAPSSAGPGE